MLLYLSEISVLVAMSGTPAKVLGTPAVIREVDISVVKRPRGFVPPVGEVPATRWARGQVGARPERVEHVWPGKALSFWRRTFKFALKNKILDEKSDQSKT
jgi:hypothetical protein